MNRPTYSNNQNQKVSSVLTRDCRIHSVNDKFTGDRYDEKRNSTTEMMPLRELLSSKAKLSFSNCKRSNRPMNVSGGRKVNANDFQTVGTPQFTCTLLARLQEINTILAEDDVFPPCIRDIKKITKKAVSFNPSIYRWYNGSVSLLDVAPLLPSRGKAFVTLSWESSWVNRWCKPVTSIYQWNNVYVSDIISLS